MKSNYIKETINQNDKEFDPIYSALSMKSYVEERKSYSYRNLLDSFSPYAFVVSLSLHLILILIVCVGVPHFHRKLPEEKVISFELLQVSSVNNVKAKKVQKDESVKNDDAKKIEKTSEMKPQEESPAPPALSPAQEEPKPEIQPLIAEKPPEPLPLEEKPKEVKPEPKKEEPKKTEPKKQEPKKEEPKKTLADKELDSLMKNLEKSSEGNDPKSNKVNREKTKEKSDAFGNFDSDMPESLTSDELIKQQIMKKWNQPIASATEEIVVIIKIFLAINGAVESTKIVSISCPTGKEAICETTKNSAIKAITNASPLVNLNSDDYNSWKEISINFDTRR